MLKYLGALFFAAALLISSEASALMRVEIPKSVKQGGIIKILITDNSDRQYEVQFGPCKWPPMRKNFSLIDVGNGGKIALIPIPPDESPGNFLAAIISSGTSQFYEIEIQKSDFPAGNGISFVGEPGGKLKKKFDGEKNELKRIFALVTPERFWKEDLKFYPPLKDMAVTSPFGQIRHKRSNKDGRWDVNHFGADLHADIGTPVFAAESGVVRIAANFLAEGNMVFIDHGYGLVSLYFHLSRLKVKEGEVVKKGEEIGRSGQSGAAVGPHLHFEIRLYGIAVSPWNFIAQPPMFEQKAVSPPAKKHSAAKPSKKRGRK